MEIQGLSEAQNLHCQHGVLRGNTPSPDRATTVSDLRIISPENDSGRLPEMPEPHSDDNNNHHHPGQRTSPFHLLVGNGSSAALPTVCKPQVTSKTSLLAVAPGVWCNNVNVEKESELHVLLEAQELVRTSWRYSAENGDASLQMALPLFEGEEEPLTQRQLTLLSPGLRQRREDAVAAAAAAAQGSTSSTNNRADTTTKEVYVVFNVFHENVTSEDKTKDGSSEDRMRAKKSEGFKASPVGSMETGDGSDVCESTDNLNCVDNKNPEHASNLLNKSTVIDAKQTVYHHTVEDVVLTNKYGEKICGQICTENNESKQVRELSSSQSRLDESGASSATEEPMDTSDFITESVRLQSSADPATASTSPPASETFSGTITINNQSIIVTIENGILTLAAPPEGHVHKDNDMVSLKEHLGMKDHEDIVLLNYDGGTKSIGKISTLAVSSSGQQEEPRPGLSVSDSELALVDDCPLSELGTSLDSCPIVKQEAGVLCAVTEADLVSQHPKAAVADCINGDFQPLSLIRSKKETASSFACPEPGCSFTFDTRQKLKIHLLNHAEDPRPYQCTFEGCAWAFATSYKLKRHLQSHDKQRPHTCHFEGCGRRFTTVYNLKAHIKVHKQDNAFVCEICNERFRSATRLNNHQRVHFEPQRPHKCEFPGNSNFFKILFSKFHPLSHAISIYC